MKKTFNFARSTLSWMKPIFSKYCVFFLSLLFFFLQARLDPDSYHDGFLLASAAAVSDGLVPNRDFVAQYGPLTPLLQGMWVSLFGVSVLVLRTLTAIQLALIAYLLNKKLRDYFSYRIAFVFTSVWVLGNPIDGLGSPVRPWPEVTSTLLVILMMRMIESERSVRQTGLFVGISLAIVSFNRINQVSIALLFFLFLIFFARKIQRKWIVFTLASYIFSVIGALSIMAVFGSLNDYFLQNVIYGFTSHYENGNGIRPALNIRILFFGLISYLFVNFITVASLKLKFRRVHLFNSAIFILSCTYFLVSGFVRNPERNLRGLESSFQRNLRLIVENSPSFSNYAFCFFLLFALKYLFVKKEFSRQDISLGLAIATLSSLYPTAAALKIWWVVPCAIYTLPNLIALKNSWHTFMQNFATFLLLPSLISLTLVSYKHFEILREPYVSQTLKGTLGIPTIRENLDNNLLRLREEVRREPIRFECMRGLYSVNAGFYQSIDRHYVIFAPPIVDTRMNSRYTFFCDLTHEEFTELFSNEALQLVYVTESEVPDLINALFENRSQWRIENNPSSND